MELPDFLTRHADRRLADRPAADHDGGRRRPGRGLEQYLATRRHSAEPGRRARAERDRRAQGLRGAGRLRPGRAHAGPRPAGLPRPSSCSARSPSSRSCTTRPRRPLRRLPGVQPGHRRVLRRRPPAGARRRGVARRPRAGAGRGRRRPGAGLRGDLGPGRAVRRPLTRPRRPRPVWPASPEAGVPFVLHVGGPAHPDPRRVHETGRPRYRVLAGRRREALRLKDFPLLHQSSEEFLSVLVLDGVLERHPDLRGAVVELGATWVPGMLRRLGPRRRPPGPSRTRGARPSPGGRRSRPASSWRSRPFSFEDVARLVRRVGRRAVPVLDRLPARRGRPEPLGALRREPRRRRPRPPASGSSAATSAGSSRRPRPPARAGVAATRLRPGPDRRPRRGAPERAEEPGRSRS